MTKLSRPPIPEPVGTANLAVLLRDAYLAIDSIAGPRVRARYPDLRPAFAPIGTQIDDAGTRITELARRTGLTKPSVVYLVDELERLGYVERVPDPEDGRAKLVKPTRRARAAVELGRKEIAAIEAEWAAALGERRIAELRSTLEELRGRLWPRAEDGG
jgi:DNA-binding MarR family transcriptional regulator